MTFLQLFFFSDVLDQLLVFFFLIPHKATFPNCRLSRSMVYTQPVTCQEMFFCDEGPLKTARRHPPAPPVTPPRMAEPLLGEHADASRSLVPSLPADADCSGGSAAHLPVLQTAGDQVRVLPSWFSVTPLVLAPLFPRASQRRRSFFACRLAPFLRCRSSSTFAAARMHVFW